MSTSTPEQQAALEAYLVTAPFASPGRESLCVVDHGEGAFTVESSPSLARVEHCVHLDPGYIEEIDTGSLYLSDVLSGSIAPAVGDEIIALARQRLDNRHGVTSGVGGDRLAFAVLAHLMGVVDLEVDAETGAITYTARNAP